MTISYKEARAEIMRAMQVIAELIKRSKSINARERYLELYDALHRELAALDNAQMAKSNEDYRAITLRFASSKAALDEAREQAQQIAAQLGSVTQFIESLTKLGSAL